MIRFVICSEPPTGVRWRAAAAIGDYCACAAASEAVPAAAQSKQLACAEYGSMSDQTTHRLFFGGGQLCTRTSACLTTLAFRKLQCIWCGSGVRFPTRSALWGSRRARPSISSLDDFPRVLCCDYYCTLRPCTAYHGEHHGNSSSGSQCALLAVGKCCGVQLLHRDTVLRMVWWQVPCAIASLPRSDLSRSPPNSLFSGHARADAWLIAQ